MSESKSANSRFAVNPDYLSEWKMNIGMTHVKLKQFGREGNLRLLDLHPNFRIYLWNRFELQSGDVLWLSSRHGVRAVQGYHSTNCITWKEIGKVSVKWEAEYSYDFASESEDAFAFEDDSEDAFAFEDAFASEDESASEDAFAFASDFDF